MQPLPGASLSFLSIKTLDGYRMAAALWQPDNKPPADAVMMVQVHGSGGNFAGLPLPAVARALSPKGFAALAINTRGHDEHINTDNFFDVRHDIEAAVATAKALGYRTIVLHGHSLGTIQVEYFAASELGPGHQSGHSHRAIRQIALEVAQYSHPERRHLQRAGHSRARPSAGR